MTLHTTVAVPRKGYEFAVDSIRRGNDVTQVLFRLVKTSEPVAGDAPKIGPTVRLDVPLGTDVAPIIEVLVDFRSSDVDRPKRYALALALSKF